MKTLTVPEVAKLLHCSVDTVRRKAAAGRLPAVKVGRAWVFVEDVLRDWLVKQSQINMQISLPDG